MIVPGQIPDSPLTLIMALIVVESGSDEGWITDANELLCQFVNWQRGEFGAPHDPNIETDTLIGKPLDAIVPPDSRVAHKYYRRAFSERPTPRTMGEGRHTPLFVRSDFDPGATGLDRIVGMPVAVLIGLSAIDERHTVAAVQPMHVGRQFALPSQQR